MSWMTEGGRVPDTLYPEIRARGVAAVAGHHLATEAAMRIMAVGGNAIDAGVAAGICLNVVQPDFTSLGGVAPIIVHSASDGGVRTISGVGCWPAAVDRAELLRRGHGRIPRGVMRCVVPAAADAWLTALERFGVLPLARVLAPAIELAEEGFSIYPALRHNLTDPGSLAAMRAWPSTREIFLDEDGDPLPVGSIVRQRDLGATLRMLVDAAPPGAAREAAIRAARDRFYRGDIADAIAGFVRRDGGWLDRQDLADFHVDVEPAPVTSYRGHLIHACGAWCQGPVVLQVLNLLEHLDLSAGGARTHHLILETLKLAFADRERYYGDPRHVAVPLDGLLSKEYARRRLSSLDESRAFAGMPEPGDPWEFSHLSPSPTVYRPPRPAPGGPEPDTSYVAVVDADGNAFSATPSDGIGASPIVPGLGFIVSGRGSQSWLDPSHPSSIAPGKRPRLTPSPGMAVSGREAMPFGTPGHDMQPQAMVQFLVNLIDLDMGVQEAIESPRCATFGFPLSSDPHSYDPQAAAIEARVPERTVVDLEARGHHLARWPAWTGTAGSLGAIRSQRSPRRLEAGADPRRSTFAAGW